MRARCNLFRRYILDSEKLKTISLKELYLYYNNIDKNKNPEQAAIILELIKERENSSVEPVISLAKLSDRLLAIIIDTLILLPFMFLYLIFFWDFPSPDYTPYAIDTLIYNLLFAQVVFLIIHGYLLYTRGQTVGKMLRNIKIVNMNNKLPSFDHLYGLRYLLVGLIGSIPLLGVFFSITDGLFIFREDRRCLHDMIAGTRVIEV